MRVPSNRIARAKSLRRALTPPEALLWTRLRRRAPGQPAFRRQHPVGPYILDFYYVAARLCVEIDGFAHSLEGRSEHDQRRTEYLNRLGIRVVRFAAKDVFADPSGVATGIWDAAIALAEELRP